MLLHAWKQGRIPHAGTSTDKAIGFRSAIAKDRHRKHWRIQTWVYRVPPSTPTH